MRLALVFPLLLAGCAPTDDASPYAPLFVLGIALTFAALLALAVWLDGKPLPQEYETWRHKETDALVVIAEVDDKTNTVKLIAVPSGNHLTMAQTDFLLDYEKAT